ncbi:MAG: DUF4258 domain-containing protein [Dehalococcoidia bacterium]|nr:DUF4258 domain-containing protein [Dehalococcoidia bacterium]MYD29735.1 DUF4258 domain-containing protein [Dehalococcoidia bacterium]
MRRFTRHARQRMRERRVSEEAVDAVLASYHTSRPASRRPGARPAVIYVGIWQNRTLRVYVRRDASPPVVTTVAWED